MRFQFAAALCTRKVASVPPYIVNANCFKKDRLIASNTDPMASEIVAPPAHEFVTPHTRILHIYLNGTAFAFETVREMHKIFLALKEELARFQGRIRRI
jgi:hypothetical protein